MLDPYIDFFTSPNVVKTFKFIYYTGYVWVPAILVLLAWNMWITYKRTEFFAKQTYVLLEIRLPKEIFKSPLSMELFFNSLYQTGGETTWIDRWWKGQTRPWFSLELVSIDGSIHFFIWTRAGFKNLIESTLYSQFPGIEIFEVPDYTLPVSYDPENVGMWATEFELTKTDPFPIKTYVDYGMDKDPKEEFKIDPMTPLIEFLGSLGRGHQAWIQIIVRAHKAEDKDPVTGKMVDLRWAKGAQVEIKKIIDTTKAMKDEEGKEKEPARRLTKGEGDVIAALERSVSKIGFDVGIRAVYTAPKDIYNQGYVGGIVGGLRNYNSSTLNGFKPSRTAGGKYDYPWQDRNKKKTNKEKWSLLDAYKRRMYFYIEHRSPHFVLNTEELATIYHFPGGVSATPTFGRVESRKAEAPVNLPQ